MPVTGVQTCALPISPIGEIVRSAVAMEQMPPLYIALPQAVRPEEVAPENVGETIPAVNSPPLPVPTVKARPAVAKAPLKPAPIFPAARGPRPQTQAPRIVPKTLMPETPAPRQARFFARMADAALLALAGATPFVVAWLWSLVNGSPLAFRLSGIAEPDSPWQGAVVFAGATMLAWCVVQMRLLTLRGQTVGKRWMNVRVVRVSDSANPGFVKAVLVRTVLATLINTAMAGGLVDALLIFREDRRCLHDLLAGTKVIAVFPGP